MGSKVDFIAQVAAFAGIVYVVTTTSGDHMQFLVLLIQVPLAAWQLVSSGIWAALLRKQTRFYQRALYVHWGAVVAYALVLGTFITAGNNLWITHWVQLAWWPVAVYYFVIATCRAFEVVPDTLPGTNNTVN